MLWRGNERKREVSIWIRSDLMAGLRGRKWPYK